MKRIFSMRGGGHTPVLAVVALLLAVGSLITTPFAWAKYTATATATTGNARVAKFDPVITLGSGWPATTDNKYVLQNSTIGMGSYDGLTFTVENKGETMINVAPSLVNPTGGAAYPGVTFNSSSGSMNIAPGQTVIVTMTIGYNTNLVAYAEGNMAELRVAVVQVD